MGKRRSSMTLAEARGILSPLGASITRTPFDEYRVTRSRYGWPGWTKERAEDIAAYETDIEAAVATGRRMAETWQNDLKY